MNIMSIADYKKQCESWFESVEFQSNEELTAIIGEMTPVEFSNWLEQLWVTYYHNFEVIVYCRAEIRRSDSFDGTFNEVKEYTDTYYSVIEDGLSQYAIYSQKQQELTEYRARAEITRQLQVSVDGTSYVAEQVIDVLWSGWDCDSKAWLVNDNGAMRVVATNHGDTYFADAAFLNDKIAEYEHAIKETRAMLARLTC